MNPQSGSHSINHTIDSCNFSNHTSSNEISWGSIGAEYNTSNNTNIYTSIKDCIFEKSMAKNAVAAISTHYRERLNFAKLEIVECQFSDLYALSEAVIHAHLVNVSLENFLFQLEDNYFYNNSIGSPNGSLVYVSMEEVKSVMEPHFVYTGNVFRQNHAFGLNIMMFNLETGVNHEIVNCNFTQNHGIAVSIRLLCYYCKFNSNLKTNVQISRVIVMHNHPNTLEFETTAITLHNINLKLSDSWFANNTGTTLVLSNVVCTFTGVVQFESNTGRTGGAVKLAGDSYIRSADNATLGFNHNYAILGGAMYIDMDYFGRCFIDDTHCFADMVFKDNNATTNGQTLFISEPLHAQCFKQYFTKCFNDSYLPSIGTAAMRLATANGSIVASMPIFPGQRLPLDFIALDAYNQSTSCVATPLLKCGPQTLICGTHPPDRVMLSGASEVTLCTGPLIANIWVQYPLHINSTVDKNIDVIFKCQRTNLAKLSLTVVECPLGLLFDPGNKTCACQTVTANSQDYICSSQYGKACVKRGYWFGLVNTSENQSVPVVAPCQFGKCNITSQGCPEHLDTNGADFIFLQGNEDNQCADNYGGIMCASCQQDAQPTFESIKCVLKKDCKPWQPYLVLILAITFQLVLAFLIVIILRKNMVGNSAVLYGPLFYVCVLQQMPLGFEQYYTALKYIVSVYSSILLLSLELFGHIPWCFFEHFHLLQNYTFHFLGPFIVAVVVLGTFALGRFCPKVLAKVQDSPVQGICLLIILSYSSLSDTSINILIPTLLPGVDTLRVRLQPELEYFSGIHIPFAIISLLILVALVIPFVCLLLFSPFLFTKVKFLQRIKPLLDEFQCCFKDRYRWYPGMYFCVGFAITALSSYTVAYQAILVLFATIHFILQPYRSRWWNALNIFLFSDLVLVSALLHEQYNPYLLNSQVDQISITFFVYALSIIPLVVFTCGGIWRVLRSANCNAHRLAYEKFKLLAQKCKGVIFCMQSGEKNDKDDNDPAIVRITNTQTPQQPQTTTSLVIGEQFYLDREPLIGLLDDNDDVEQITQEQYNAINN